MVLKVLRSIMSRYRAARDWARFTEQWNRRNPHNTVRPVGYVPLHLVTVGAYSYGQLRVIVYRPDTVQCTVRIGNFVSISSDVRFILDGNHPMDTYTTYPLKSMLTGERAAEDANSKGDILIEDEVWVGHNVTFLSGVRVGRGAIIAAGSVVTKDIPDFTVAGGVPARLIRRRFGDEMERRVASRRLIEIPRHVIESNLALFYRPLDEATMSDIERLFSASEGEDVE